MTSSGPEMADARGPSRLAVLASHEGTVLQAVIDACARRALHWEIAVVGRNLADPSHPEFGVYSS